MPSESGGRLKTLRRHQLPVEVFADACHGAMPRESLAVIRATQYSRRKLLLRTLLDLLREAPGAQGPLTDPVVAWRILATAEERDPEAAEDVLMYPTAGGWVIRTTRRLLGAISSDIPLWAEVGYLHSLVAAAAFRVAIPFSLRLPVLFGSVNLPTVGQIRLPGSFPAGIVDLEHDQHGLHVRAGSREFTLRSAEETAVFLPTRSHTSVSGAGVLRVRLEDTDPYREFSAPRPPRRLDSAGFAEWNKLLAEAWELVGATQPAYAGELSLALAMLTPTDADPRLFAASSSAAFGGMIVSPKRSATLLAEAMVHELQHSKLNALLELVRLIGDPGEATWYAPWRDDPRPAIALFHGIYAFGSTVEFNRDRRITAERSARFLFALRRDQIRQSIAAARQVPGLTGPGTQFVEAAASRLARAEGEPVDPALAEVVALLTLDHRACWRLRHHSPDPAVVGALTTRFLHGRVASHEDFGEPVVRADHRPVDSSWRDVLLRLKVLDPDEYTRISTNSDSPVPRSDLVFAARDYPAAAALYRARLAADPQDGQAWIGLGLALHALGDRDAANGLLRCPEITVAMVERIGRDTGAAPDPVALAAWVGRGLDATTA